MTTMQTLITTPVPIILTVNGETVQAELFGVSSLVKINGVRQYHINVFMRPRGSTINARQSSVVARGRKFDESVIDFVNHINSVYQEVKQNGQLRTRMITLE